MILGITHNITIVLGSDINKVIVRTLNNIMAVNGDSTDQRGERISTI